MWWHVCKRGAERAMDAHPIVLEARGPWRPSMSCLLPWMLPRCLGLVTMSGRKEQTTPGPARVEAGIPLPRQITCHFVVGTPSTQLDSPAGGTDDRPAGGGRVSNRSIHSCSTPACTTSAKPSIQIAQRVWDESFKILVRFHCLSVS